MELKIDIECTECKIEECVKYNKIGDICKRCQNGILQLKEIKEKDVILYSTYKEKEVKEINKDEFDIVVKILNIKNISKILKKNEEIEITYEIWKIICEKFNKNHIKMIERKCQDGEYMYEYQCMMSEW